MTKFEASARGRMFESYPQKNMLKLFSIERLSRPKICSLRLIKLTYYSSGNATQSQKSASIAAPSSKPNAAANWWDALITPEMKELEALIKKAETGDLGSMIKLAYRYQVGIGTSKDEKQAFKWLLKAAKAGYSLAQNAVGHRYRTGHGTMVNSAKAFHWFQKSASR